MVLFPQIEAFIAKLNTASLTKERQQILQRLTDYIYQKTTQNQPVQLAFICTHNSRRSQFCQIWAQTFAHYAGLEKITCYSGGTTVTALFSEVVTTLANSGFQIEKLSSGRNPIYSIKYAENVHPIIGFSKKMDASFNPQTGFAAVMTCAQAEAECPVVPGAEIRIPLSYEDPKIADNTPQQTRIYQERNQQIATELFYVFTQLNTRLWPSKN